jgi:surface polysaccharide O-acyltransferase-like enzyme
LFSPLLNINYNNPNYKSVWRLETMSYWAVNGFGLISGIVGYRSYKFSNAIFIWIQASFYSEAISLYLYYIKRITKKDLFLSLFPILIMRQWYVNAYLFLYLFMPFINFGINNVNRKTYKNIIILFFIFYAILNVISKSLVGNSNYNFLNNGYSTLWLTILQYSTD